jgi:ABC-type branched-subunit amino acid transport system substrate-binding protein
MFSRNLFFQEKSLLSISLRTPACLAACPDILVCPERSEGKRSNLITIRCALPSASNFRALCLSIVMLLPLLIAGCQALPQFWGAGILSAQAALDGSGNALIAAEQLQGYQQAEKAEASDLEWEYVNEGIQQDDLQTAVRQLIETNQVLIFAGATSNESTMRAAALANFFNVAMVIPSSVADNLLPSNNLWAFRLSAPGSAHAGYLFQTLLNKQVLHPFTGDSLAISKIAIIYEQNTFGESSAVVATRQAMQQELLIKVYGSFDPSNPDPNSLRVLINKIRLASVDLVYMISSNPGVASQLIQELHAQFTPGNLPVLVGQSGGFASLDFLNSPHATGVYVLRQKLDLVSCPVTNGSLTEAQAYAAIYLMNYAVQQAQKSQASPQTGFSLPQTISAVDRLNSLREAVRDELKNASLDVPCLGKVSFDNSGQNKQVTFELVTVRDGRLQILTAEAFLNELRNR